MENLKKMMTAKHVSMTSTIRSLKADVKKLLKAGDRRDAEYIERKIAQLESSKDFYAIGKYEPVRFKSGLVVNGKLVKAYLNKLPKQAVVTWEINEDILTIHFNVAGGSMGRLNLKDLSVHYEGYELPEGEVLFDGNHISETRAKVH